MNYAESIFHSCVFVPFLSVVSSLLSRSTVHSSVKHVSAARTLDGPRQRPWCRRTRPRTGRCCPSRRCWCPSGSSPSSSCCCPCSSTRCSCSSSCCRCCCSCGWPDAANGSSIPGSKTTAVGGSCTTAGSTSCWCSCGRRSRQKNYRYASRGAEVLYGDKERSPHSLW